MPVMGTEMDKETTRMSMLLNPEQQQLRDSASAFLQAQTPVEQLRRLRNDKVLLGYDADT